MTSAWRAPDPARAGYAIVGLGLMGGSVAAAMRSRFPHAHLVGVDRDPAVVAQALGQGLIHEGGVDLAGLQRVDVVILAAPVDAILEIIPRLPGVLGPGCLVTDVGSVKQAIVQAYDRLDHPLAAVGGHPMAGSERAGLAAADERLLEGATFVLTPGRCSPPEGVRFLETWSRSLGMRPFILTPEEHDRTAALVSHLPYLVACALAAAVGEHAGELPVTRLATGGFRDTSRLAASSPGMMGPVVNANAAFIREALDGFEAALHRLRAAAGGGAEALRPQLEAAGKYRTHVLSPVPEEGKG